MRFAVCMEEGERRLGVVRGDRVATLGSSSPDLLEVIGWGRDGLEAISKQADVLPAGAWRPLSAVRLALPFQPAGKVICLGLNYRAHAREGGYEVPDYPALFLRVATSLLPAGVKLVSGNFSRGDTVAVLSPEAREIARGLVAYDAADAVRIAGLKTAEIEAVLGYEARSAMIHRDDLVVNDDAGEYQGG